MPNTTLLTKEQNTLMRRVLLMSTSHRKLDELSITLYLDEALKVVTGVSSSRHGILTVSNHPIGKGTTNSFGSKTPVINGNQFRHDSDFTTIDTPIFSIKNTKPVTFIQGYAPYSEEYQQVLNEGLCMVLKQTYIPPRFHKLFTNASITCFSRYVSIDAQMGSLYVSYLGEYR